MNKQLPPEQRLAARLKLATMPRTSSATSICNRCLVTGRTRGVYRTFTISCIMLREMASEGLIPGVRNASWRIKRMMTDPISDMLARIKNACQRYCETVDILSSTVKIGISQVLEREGYINGFKEVTVDNRAVLRVELIYYEGKPVI